MPKGKNQKLKLYYLARIMQEKTDDEHGITLAEIKQYLEEYDVTANRKILYEDLETLKVLGLDVIGEKIGWNYYYHVGQKQFDIAELKLLVDSVQSSKFITEKKSSELIKKITSFASDYEAKLLKRQVMVQGRVKTMNESIFYNVDSIHAAISKNSGITMDYYRWDTNKNLVPTSKGTYSLSPWALMWSDENYYLVAYDEVADKIKHFRVDKMKNIQLTGDKRKGRELFKEFDLVSYSQKNFGMYGGEDAQVELHFKDELVGVLIDHFGKSITIRPVDGKEGWSRTRVIVAVSEQFFGWIFGLGAGVRIAGPDEVVDEYVKKVEEMRGLYK